MGNLDKGLRWSLLKWGESLPVRGHAGDCDIAIFSLFVLQWFNNTFMSLLLAARLSEWVTGDSALQAAWSWSRGQLSLTLAFFEHFSRSPSSTKKLVGSLKHTCPSSTTLHLRLIPGKMWTWGYFLSVLADFQVSMPLTFGDETSECPGVGDPGLFICL